MGRTDGRAGDVGDPGWGRVICCTGPPRDRREDEVEMMEENGGEETVENEDVVQMENGKLSLGE